MHKSVFIPKTIDVGPAFFAAVLEYRVHPLVMHSVWINIIVKSRCQTTISHVPHVPTYIAEYVCCTMTEANF